MKEEQDKCDICGKWYYRSLTHPRLTLMRKTWTNEFKFVCRDCHKKPEINKRYR